MSDVAYEADEADEDFQEEVELQGDLDEIEAAGAEEDSSDANWRDLVSDPKLRSSTEKYNSLEDMIKAHNHLGGELRNRVKYPDASASDEEIEAYRRAAGVPDTPEDYVLPEVEDYEYDEMDEVELASWAEWAYDNNIPQAAFMDLIRSRVEDKIGTDREHQKILQAQQERAENDLREEWGSDYDANIEFAARAAHGIGGEEFVEILESVETDDGVLLGDMPEIVRFLSSIGRMNAEHDPSMITTPGERMSVNEEIQQIMNENPPGSPGYSNPQVQGRLAELYEYLEGKNYIAP